MQALMSRRLLKRVFTYASDSSKLAEMKKGVGEATHQLQLETVMATGREVDLISQEQRLMFQKQEDNQRSIIQQQYLMSQQQYLIIQNSRYIDRLVELLGHGAAKKRPCMDGTRIDLFERITKWVERPSDCSRICISLLGAAGRTRPSQRV
ncbi:hypothetical protein FRB93_007656 [Tulasnella sp. JGI-2019a]|nr:hypothetical protein FRB93_007656 [Tulasnella sp. JGI-2019a]